jgi:excisionase family DNA binding protein
MAEDPLLKVTEVAARLRVSTETVRRWLRRGRLRGVLLGGDRGGYRIPASELDRLLGMLPPEAAEPPGPADRPPG